MPRILRTSALLLIASGAPAMSFAQQLTDGTAGATAQRAPAPLTSADYARWEMLGNGALSPDGHWVAYDYRRVSGGGELRYSSTAGGTERSVAFGTNPTFTKNSRWMLYVINGDTSATAGGGRGRRGRGSGMVSTGHRSDRVGIVELRTGATTVLKDVQSFVLSQDGLHVALRRYAPAGRRTRGADLVVRDLARGTDLTFGNVADYVWSDDGSMLAMTMDVDGSTGNGIVVLNAATGTLRSLDASDQLYSNPVWRTNSNDLVAFRSRTDSAFADTSYTVVAWRGLGTTHISNSVYDFTTDSSFPAAMRVAAYRDAQWSDDGSTVYFGIAPRTPKVKRAARNADAPKPARVEVWHWKDLRQYHQQDRQAQQDRRKSYLTAWHLGSTSAVRLADEELEDIRLSENGKSAIAWTESPYFDEVISGRQYRDVYAIDTHTGKREKVATRLASGPSLSPDGRYLMYTQDGQWWSYDLTTHARANLTGRIATTFVNTEDDHPVAEYRAYGMAGWTTGEKAVILYDKYDLWKVNVDGSSPVQLTRGREDSTVYRYVSTDPDERVIDTSVPMLLSATGEWNKKSGYARVSVGKPAQRLLWADRDVGSLEKASDADVYLFSQESYEDSPDFFVSGPAFADARQISRTNAFQSEYAWSKQVLMNYVNERGDTLQMMLTYPAGYEPGKKYPMVVYYYEKLSQGFHQYIVPTERSTYNTTVFSQNGYFVLRPDIRFLPRDPGYSGLECVTPAVNKVLATGMVDSKRVGNMGHSWGGYQSAFYAVHGNGMFAATIAGAPLTNLVSFYGYTSFNSGLPETGHFETGQERMQVSLWEDPQAYIRNSTVFAMDSLQTPLLLEEGDADGNVNYWQSMELYNFGRRLGKQVVFLLYNDENHGVARPESQMDYHTRQLQWFAHYLKGEPAADWITNGETYLARQKLLEQSTTPKDGPAPGSSERSPRTAVPSATSRRVP